MRLLVQLHMFETNRKGRQSPIASGYRPNFSLSGLPNRKRQYYDATIELLDTEILAPGESAMAYLLPTHPAYWSSVREGQVVVACEAERPVGDAIVRQIITD